MCVNELILSLQMHEGASTATMHDAQAQHYKQQDCASGKPNNNSETKFGLKIVKNTHRSIIRNVHTDPTFHCLTTLSESCTQCQTYTYTADKIINVAKLSRHE